VSIPRTKWPLDLLRRARDLHATGLAWREVAARLSTPDLTIDAHRLRTAVSDVAPSPVQETPPVQETHGPSASSAPAASPGIPRRDGAGGPPTRDERLRAQGFEPVIPSSVPGMVLGTVPRETQPPVQERAPRTVIILADLHAPDHDERALSAVLSLMDDLKPDECVLLGDAAELESCSSFRPPSNNYAEECAAATQVLSQIVSRARRTVLVEGNHDHRPQKWAEQQAPQLKGSLSVKRGLDLDGLGIQFVPHDQQPYSVGNLDLLHGHQDLRGRFTPVYFAAKLLARYGLPGRTVMFGHTHRHQTLGRQTHLGKCRSVGLGCMRTLRPGWLEGEASGWEQQFAVAHIEAGVAHVQVVDVSDGAFWFGGRRYAA
jgi:predicted phosphodiesterase